MNKKPHFVYLLVSQKKISAWIFAFFSIKFCQTNVHTFEKVATCQQQIGRYSNELTHNQLHYNDRLLFALFLCQFWHYTRIGFSFSQGMHGYSAFILNITDAAGHSFWHCVSGFHPSSLQFLFSLRFLFLCFYKKKKNTCQCSFLTGWLLNHKCWKAMPPSWLKSQSKAQSRVGKKWKQKKQKQGGDWQPEKQLARKEGLT